MAKVKHQRGVTNRKAADPWPRVGWLFWEVVGLALGAALLFMGIMGLLMTFAAWWGR